MSKNLWTRYKRHYGKIPKCISCGHIILVGEKAERMGGTKYLCKECSKKDVVVYQYPKPTFRPFHKRQKFNCDKNAYLLRLK